MNEAGIDGDSKIVPLHLHPVGFIEVFTQLGANLTALLEGTGISDSLLAMRGAKISYSQQKRLVANGLVLCRRPGLGLIIGTMLDWNFYGTVGGIVNCSPSLREAGEAFRRYIMIAQPYYALLGRKPNSYVDANHRVIQPLRTARSPLEYPALAQFELDFRLASALRIWDVCGNKSVADPSIHVKLAIPEPPHAHMYRSLPCATLQFNAEDSNISAHSSYVVEPFRQYRRQAFDRIIERCEQELAETNLENTYTAKVRWQIYAHFDKQLTLDQVAELLRMTPRALTRRLGSEQTSFRDILHQVRMELTSHHLRCSHMSVEQLSELMGFSSPSSLRRAIRNWSGTSVGEVRRRPSDPQPLDPAGASPLAP
jgi:AraC-like DNA-binding protein